MRRLLPIHERGLSLVELLLGLAIAAMVLAPLVQMPATASNAARIGGDQLAVEREADFALERIVARIRASSSSAELLGSSCGGVKPAAYDVNAAGTLIETVGTNKYVLADSVTCLTLASLSSSSGRTLVQVSLKLTRNGASTAATAVVPLGVAP